MKKYILSIASLFIYLATFAQDAEEHSAEYNWGKKNALYVIIGVLLVIILIIVWMRNRKKKSS